MSTASKSKTSFGCIDIIKFIMAILVIGIHTRPFDAFEKTAVVRIYDQCTLLAVPFFFLVTGYFLEGKDTAGIGKQLRKYTRLYIVWTAIYFPMAAIYAVNNHTPLLNFVLSYIRGLFFRGEQYNSWMLWYLLSTVYALVFILLAKKKRFSTERIAFIGGAIMLFSFAIDQLQQLETASAALGFIQKIVRVTIFDGRILRGLFFIPLGMLLSKHGLSVGMYIAVFVSSFAADLYFDSVLLTHVFWILSSVGLFGISKSISMPKSPLYLVLRKMSTAMYFLHMYVWTAYYWLIYREKTYGLDSFIVTVVSCILLSGLYMYAENSRGKQIVSE